MIEPDANETREFYRLLDGYLVGRMTDDELSRFNRLLRENDAYAQLVHTVAVVATGVRDLDAIGLSEGRRSIATPQARASEEALVRRRAWISRPVLAVAACVAIALAIVGVYLLALDSRGEGEPDDASTPIATLIDASDGAAVVVNEHLATRGEDYGRGVYAIDGGSAQFLLTNQATVTLRGKTRVRMHGPLGATLDHGTARFHCPPAAAGYAVTTPAGVRIVDLGTEFEVTVDPLGNALVRVFDGQVEVSDERVDSATPDVRRLAAGESVRWIDGRFVIGDSDLTAIPGDRVINVDFGAGPAYTGPGLAATEARLWNRVPGRSADRLRTADGSSVTPVGLTTTAPVYGQIAGQGVGLFDDYVFKHTAPEGWSITLHGLDDQVVYDVVVYAATGYGQGSTFAVDDQAAVVTGDSTAALVDTVNYARFTGLRPTDGRLEIRLTEPDAKIGGYMCNGLQLIARAPFAGAPDPSSTRPATQDPPRP